jgi:hypothetical protein
MVGMPMLVGAFMTLLVSSSLFPNERDFRILGPLPIERGVVFGAKLIALGVFVSGFITVTLLSLVPLFLLTSRNPWGEHVVPVRLAAWIVSSACASAFAVLAIAVMTGLLGLLRPSAQLQSLTTASRSLVLSGLVFCVPLVVRLSNRGPAMAAEADWLLLVPPAWFVGLERVLMGVSTPWFETFATIAVGALGGAAVAVAGLYGLLFRHVERLVLRPRVVPRAGSTPTRQWVSGRAPGYLAARLFIGTTLMRGPLQQGVVVGLAMCGVGVAVIGLGGEGWRDGVLWAPFAVMLACGLGIRASLALPIEHRANWIFRITESGVLRVEQLRAVEDMTAACLVLPPAMGALPLLWATVGTQAFLGSAVIAVVGLVFLHIVLLDWRRIPFTCSYLPGKRFAAQSLFVGLGGSVVFVVASEQLLAAALADIAAAVVILGAGLVVSYALHRRRLKEWVRLPLIFEDEFPDTPMALDL